MSRYKSRYWGKISKQYLTNICKRDDGSLFALEPFEYGAGFHVLEIDRNDVIEEPCTGRTDISGTLIYEGDKVRGQHYESLDEDGNFVPDDMWYTESEIGPFGEIDVNDEDYDCTLLRWLDDYEIEIIGNVHDE
jgi:hypothetical protein